VGALQLDVVEARLLAEYGIRCRIEPLAHVAARWPVPIAGDAPPVKLPTSGVMSVRDTRDRPVLLFQSDWHLRYTTEENAGIRFHETL
jgi:peptide chain release factor 3